MAFVDMLRKLETCYKNTDTFSYTTSTYDETSKAVVPKEEKFTIEQIIKRISDIEKTVPMLFSKGICRKNIKTKFDDYGTHSESYWAKEFPAAYIWLFK